jgi:hypothetical protein
VGSAVLFEVLSAMFGWRAPCKQHTEVPPMRELSARPQTQMRTGATALYTMYDYSGYR